MARPSVVRVLIKDLIDFAFIASCTLALTATVYTLLPRFIPVTMSIYFFEQLIEVFFVNPRLLLWLTGLGFGISTLYFLVCGLVNIPTLGALFTGVRLVDYRSKQDLNPVQALLMALGAFFGFLFLCVGPLFAWWLQRDHRGFAELFSGTVVVERR